MNNQSTNLIQDQSHHGSLAVKREKILMAESALGERYLGDDVKGSTFFETAHGVFPDFGSAERFAMNHFKNVRWLIADRVTRDDKKPTYDFLIKPRSARKHED